MASKTNDDLSPVYAAKSSGNEIPYQPNSLNVQGSPENNYHDSDSDNEENNSIPFPGNREAHISSNDTSQNIETLFSLYTTYVEKLPSHLHDIHYEFEVRFRESMLNKMTYQNVFKVLCSHGFTIKQQQYLLRIAPQKEGIRGRVECSNLSDIQQYCLTEQYPKRSVYVEKYSKLQNRKPVYNQDYNFRVSVQEEKQIHHRNHMVKDMMIKWSSLKKNFRYLYRTTLVHASMPHVQIDMSVVRSSREPNTYFARSNVLSQPSRYEIEIECVGMESQTMESLNVKKIVQHFKLAIKYILSGIQKTPFPVAFPILEGVKDEYNSLCRIINNIQNPNIRIKPYFMGPSSITLQPNNLVKDDNKIGIQKGFCVTDKADGERKLLFINKKNKAYLIDSNLVVSYAGFRLKRGVNLTNTILDGEHIVTTKSGSNINLFAAFDIYCERGNDVRNMPFIEDRNYKSSTTSRYELLKSIISKFTSEFLDYDSVGNQLNIQYKQFIHEESIFDSCKMIFETLDRNYIYNTDGLIFTSKYLGVPRKTSKITWRDSFKWKPAHFNTIDFLMKVRKNEKGEKEIKTKLVSGVAVKYYEVELYVGSNEAGAMNTQEQILMNDLQESTRGYGPILFRPTNPSEEEAYLCHIHATLDETDSYVMYSEEKDLIEDDQIVEFRYMKHDDDKYENWIPLRVRDDKTVAYRTKKDNFGNNFKTANNNWQSIHNPVTEDMLKGFVEVTQDDLLQEEENENMYYNRGKSKNLLLNLRHFHNMYVKSLLIDLVSSNGDHLIDFAVGKAGDLNKWIKNKIGGVLGIDIFKDNIYGSRDSACDRYKSKLLKKEKDIPISMFVHGNSGKLIENGDFSYGNNPSSHDIVKALMGSSDVEKQTIVQPFLKTNYGIFIKKFDISSIQFAMHYMFENKKTLHNFLTNVAKYTKINGYFIGTCFNGEKLFDMLKDIQQGESKSIYIEDKEIWHVTKKYNTPLFTNTPSSVGLKIGLYQESINKTSELDEFLVHFGYFVKIMDDYGFKPANEFPIPPIGSFQELHNRLLSDTSLHGEYEKAKHFAEKMSAQEKEISFLNQYFIFKKYRENILPVYNPEEFEPIDLTVGYAEKTEQKIQLV